MIIPTIHPHAELAILWGYPLSMLLWLFIEREHIGRYWQLRSLIRGTWAPIFMAKWMGVAWLGLLVSMALPEIKPWFLWAMQIDFACIMITAGVAKVCNGYLENRGGDLGLINPMWSFFPGFWRKWHHPKALWVWVFNQSAWSFEIIAGILMFIPYPETRVIGAILIAGPFIFLGTQLRVGVLPFHVILSCFLFWPTSF